MKLKLHMDDYITAAGGVGLLRLQDWACSHLADWRDLNAADRPIQAKRDFLEVDASVLDHIPEWYFKYLLDTHSVAKRERERFKGIADFRYLTAKDQIARLKDAINDYLKRIEKYFAGHPGLTSLRQCLDEVKSLSVDQAASSLEQLRDRYLEILETDMFDERLTFNYIRSVILKNFFGQASMLQKSMSGYNLQQHIDRMTLDFIDPLKLDIQIHEMLRQGISDEEQKAELLTLLKQSKFKIHQDWAKEIKKLALQQIPDFMIRQLQCSFEEDWYATQLFEEMVFVPLGISGSIPNFMWDFHHHPTPISSWIRLVMFIAPVGLTRFTRFYNKEFETYYNFVFRDGSPQSIYRDNNDLDNLEHNESFERLIPKLLQREEHKAKIEAAANMQIIEFYSDYDSRKTVMNYYHVPRHMLMYFGRDDINKMNQLFDRSIRDPFLKLVMESVDPVTSIWTYLQKVTRGEGNAHANAAYAAVRERFKIQFLKKKEVLDMSAIGEIKKTSGLIYHVYMEGVKVRNALEKRANLQSETTEYVAEGGKRAAGIAHRLLNAAKAGNKQQFLDTVIRLYLTVGEPVPSSMLNVLHEKRLDFASWSGAFISGLLSDGKMQENADERAENAVENP